MVVVLIEFVPRVILNFGKFLFKMEVSNISFHLNGFVAHTPVYGKLETIFANVIYSTRAYSIGSKLRI